MVSSKPGGATGIGRSFAGVAAGVVLWLGIGLTSLFGATWLESQVLEPLALSGGAGSLGHGLVLAGFVAVWGAASAVSVPLLVSRVCGGPRRPIKPGLVAGVGLLLAVALTLVLHEWARGRYGYFDPDTVGPTWLLPGLLVALSVAVEVLRFATDRLLQLTAGIVGMSGLAAAAIVALNLPGALDGIRPESVPLAALVGALALYLGLVGLIVARLTGTAPGKRDPAPPAALAG